MKVFKLKNYPRKEEQSGLPANMGRADLSFCTDNVAVCFDQFGSARFTCIKVYIKTLKSPSLM